MLKILQFLLFITLLAYVGYRAYALSFTHDEALSYLDYTHLQYGKILNPDSPSANNHILNTWLMRFMQLHVSNKPFALRLPNVLAFIMYFVCCTAWLKQFQSSLIRFGGLLILCINPYLLDFFSLARGYGLAIGCMAASVLFLDRYLKIKDNSKLVYALLFAALAVFANFALLNYFICLPVLFVLANAEAVKGMNGKRFLKQLAIVVVFFALLFLILKGPINHLRQANALYFGGNTGIWHDTIWSLVWVMMYEHAYPYPIVDYVLYLFPAAFILGLILSVVKVARYKFNAVSNPVFYTTVIVGLILLSIVLQHVLLGTKYLTERTALFIVPLILLMLISVIHEASKYNWARLLSRGILVLICISCIYHFKTVANFSYCRDWAYDADIQHEMQYMEHLKPAVPGQKVTIGMSWLHTPAARYYAEVLHENWLTPCDFQGDKKFDYYIIDGDNLNDFKALPLEKVQHFDIRNYYLMRYVR